MTPLLAIALILAAAVWLFGWYAVLMTVVYIIIAVFVVAVLLTMIVFWALVGEMR